MGLTTIGCATTGTLQNGVYRGTQTTYQIGPLSSDWTPVTVNHQNDLAWHDEAKGAKRKSCRWTAGRRFAHISSRS